MEIHGLNRLTLLDYPDRVACTIFTGHCNFRCPFCQNSMLVLDPGAEPQIREEEVMDFLTSRKGRLKGVCISGGEPTLQPDLREFIVRIRALGYPVKLDTNGYRPDVLEQLLGEGLLDMVAMDIKSSRRNYGQAAGVPDLDVSRIERSAALLMRGTVPFEFRTTMVRQLQTYEDMMEIAQWLAGDEPYFLQSYEDSEGVMDRQLSAFTKEELREMLELLHSGIPNARLRGVD
ncbi:MAG: anaerobic ribonucleoside-triphosphate reductase activating protein [Lachnospiraceae bacterium]|jgi:pyruvate formate lyase activating enzyme|nr:anaerobic ribonucleoside-triphosphate reductase activating protein [Lachnospiraceae bacterium]